MTPEAFVQEAAELGWPKAVIGPCVHANWSACLSIKSHNHILLSRQHHNVWLVGVAHLTFDYSLAFNPDMKGALGPFESVGAALATLQLLHHEVTQ